MSWSIPSTMTAQEQKIAARLKRTGRFYVFLREVLPQLFDEAFVRELSAAYKPRGQEPLPPALLATVTLLQAYDQASDAEAVLNAEMDKRWQLVLGILGAEHAPFSQGTLPCVGRAGTGLSQQRAKESGTSVEVVRASGGSAPRPPRFNA